MSPISGLTLATCVKTIALGMSDNATVILYIYLGVLCHDRVIETVYSYS